MTSEGAGGADREPTLADILTAVQALATGQRTLAEKADGLAEALGTQGDALDRLSLDFAAHAELAQARHTETTQTLETLSGLAHAHSGALTDLSGKVGRGELRLTSHIEDVQRVIQALKADIAAHLDDPDAHHRRGNAA